MNYTRADIINALCAEWDYLCHDDFDPEKYFDILDNNWKLDKFPEKITEAHLKCTGKPDKIFKG